MSPRHAAALALVVWYLMIPPINVDNKVDAHAPMWKWKKKRELCFQGGMRAVSERRHSKPNNTVRISSGSEGYAEGQNAAPQSVGNDKTDGAIPLRLGQRSAPEGNEVISRHAADQPHDNRQLNPAKLQARRLQRRRSGRHHVDAARARRHKAEGFHILVSSAPLHCDIVIERGRKRDLEIVDKSVLVAC